MSETAKKIRFWPVAMIGLATGFLMVGHGIPEGSVTRTDDATEWPAIEKRCDDSPRPASPLLDLPGGSPWRSPATPEPPRSAVAAWPKVRPVQGPNGVEIAAGEILVLPKPGRSQALEERLRKRSDIAAIRHLALSGAYRIRLAADVSYQTALQTIGSMPECTTATPNAVVRATGRDKSEKKQLDKAFWNLKKSGLRPDEDLQSPQERSDYVIALLDSGVATASPGLSQTEIVAPADTLDGDADPNDENGHGTFLANLMVGDPGIAHGAALMPVRVLDEDLVGTEASLVEGLRHATLYGADVINLSLVFAPGYRPTQIIDAAIADALSSDVVIVAAAGNNAEPTVAYPAAFPGVVAVGASTLSGKKHLTRAHYSSWGAALDLLAPGGDLDADENGDGIVDGIIAESFDPDDPTSFGYWLYAGTSQSAAHASAAAVWVLAAEVPPNLVPAALRGGAKDDKELGTAGFDIQTGGGHLNILRSIKREPRLVVTGVQMIPVFRQEDGGKALGAVVTVVNEEGDAVSKADVYAKFWNTAEQSAVCETDRDGICILDGSLLEGDGDVAAIAIEAVVLRNGRVSRPKTVAARGAVDAALAQTDGSGFGSSSIVWYVDPSFSSFWWWYAMNTWFLFGSGEGSALAPTVIALGEDAALDLVDGGAQVDGSGFGSSSLNFVTLNWYSYYFFGGWFWGWPVYGGGFGSSSIPYSIYWGGWAFLWQSFYSGWYFGAEVTGSPLHEIAGTIAGDTQAASVPMNP